MNPKLVAVLVVAVTALAFAALAAILVAIDRRAGVRRREYNLAMDTIDAVMVEAERYTDLDSPLAAAVKDIVRGHGRRLRAMRRP